MYLVVRICETLDCGILDVIELVSDEPSVTEKRKNDTCLIPWLFAPGLSFPYPSKRLMTPHTARPAPRDYWTRYRHDGREIGDTRRYEMLGNSIAVPCAAYIMQGMRQILAGDED